MIMWDGIYGQDITLKILEKLIKSNKIPHAFLFTGIEGIGKEFAAIKFAQNLNSTSLEKADQSINNFISSFSEPYIKYIYPLPRGKNETDESGPYEKLSQEDIQTVKEEISKKTTNPYYKLNIPKANNIKISSIRDIKKFLSFNFQDIKYRVVLINDAHLMNEEAQNALLKNLEEPPEGIIFILVSPYPGLLRETIRSRCNSIHFRPLSDKTIKEILIKYFNIDEEAAAKASLFANGSVSFALKLIENDINLLLNKTISILRYSLGKKFSSALTEIAYFSGSNSGELISILINMILIWLNDLIKFRHKKEIYFKEYLETIQKFSVRSPEIDITEIITRLDYLNSSIKNNLNMNLIALNVIFELSTLTDKKVTSKHIH